MEAFGILSIPILIAFTAFLLIALSSTPLTSLFYDSPFAFTLSVPPVAAMSFWMMRLI